MPLQAKIEEKTMNNKSKLVHNLNFDLPAAAEYVVVARLAISGVASRMDFTIEEIEDIKIAVSEACTNCVQHAYLNQPQEGRISMRCDVYEDKLHIAVSDTGKGFDPAILGSEIQRENSETNLGLGLGLTFVKSLMDESDFQSEAGKGTTISMAKYKPSSNTK